MSSIVYRLHQNRRCRMNYSPTNIPLEHLVWQLSLHSRPRLLPMRYATMIVRLGTAFSK